MGLALTVQILGLVFSLLTPSEGQDAAVPKVAPTEAGRYVGRIVTVCGRIVGITCPPEDARAQFTLVQEPRPLFTTYRTPRRDATLRATISAGERPALGTRLGRFFLREVCATGGIERDSRGLYIATTPAQLVVHEPPTETPEGFGEEAYTVCDEGVAMPTLLRDRKPQYTADAMRALKQGAVLLAAVVLPSGRVGEVVVTVSLDKDDLDKEAIRAMKDWRFKPGTRAGQPVPVVVTVEMAFALR